jgi:very-short-patch-repair endonuclease
MIRARRFIGTPSATSTSSLKFNVAVTITIDKRKMKKKLLDENSLKIADLCNTVSEFAIKINRSSKGNGGKSVKKFLGIYNHRLVSKINIECLTCKKIWETRNCFNSHLSWCGKTDEQKEEMKKNLQSPRKYKPTEETRKKISNARKKYIATHGNNWKTRNKKSEPEIKFEFILKKYFSKDFNFELEFTPPASERFFRIDFAVTKYEIGFEINGNQHYNSDGSLRTYYKERHLYLESLGWKILEIPSAFVFNEAVAIKIIKDSFKEKNIQLTCEINTSNITINEFKPKSPKPKSPKIQEASSLKLKQEKPKKISKCPPKEILENLIWEMSQSEVAKQFNVSDNAVKKWCAQYGIKKPTQGHWLKNRSHVPTSWEKYLYLNPNGEEIIVENLAAFCRENNLKYESMRKIQYYKKGSKSHRQKTCFGWQFIKKL